MKKKKKENLKKKSKKVIKENEKLDSHIPSKDNTVKVKKEKPKKSIIKEEKLDEIRVNSSEKDEIREEVPPEIKNLVEDLILTKENEIDKRNTIEEDEVLVNNSLTDNKETEIEDVLQEVNKSREGNFRSKKISLKINNNNFSILNRIRNIRLPSLIKRHNNRDLILNTSTLNLENKPTKRNLFQRFNNFLRQKKVGVIFFKLFIGVSIMTAVVIILLFNYLILPGKRIWDAYNDIKTNFYSLASDIKDKNLSNINSYITHIDTDLNTVNIVIDQYSFLENYDLTKGYYKNFKQLRVILTKTNTLIDFSLPKLKDLLITSGFTTSKANNSSISSSSSTSSRTSSDTAANKDQAISLIMKEFPLYLELYNQMEPQIIDILSQINQLDLNYIPNVGNLKLKETVSQIDQFSGTYPQISSQVVNFIKNLPSLLGVQGDATYLLVLQTEAEIRSSGGIISAYGILNVSNGQVGNISIFDTWTLNDFLVAHGLGFPGRNIYGQLYLMQYGCGGAAARPQDVPQYPDLFYSMNQFRQYYDRAHNYDPTKFPGYKYLMVIDNSFAQNLLSVVGPTTLDDGTVVTSDNFFNLIKSQSDNSAIYHGANTNNRKTIIKTIANAVKAKFLTLPITSVPLLVNSIIKSFNAKDISFSTTDSNMQAFFDQYGLTARTVKDYTGDYFQINETQNCSLKLNLFVRDNVVNDININSNGSINENVHIHWIQPQIYNPSLIHEYEPTYNHSYRAWIRIFTPVDTYNIKSDGYRESGYLFYPPIHYYDSVMDKQVSDSIIQFDHRRFKNSDPIDKKDLYISYTLPNTINYNKAGGFSQIIQKDPGKSWGEKYQIIIHYNNSSYSTSFTLDRDKLLTFKDGVITLDNNDKRLDWITNFVNSVPWDKLSNTKTPTK